MEAEAILHRGDALALLGLSDDRGGPGESAAALQRLDHLLHVVAVDLDRVPAEGLELGAHVSDVHDVLGGAVGLKMVVVDDRGQVVDAEVDRRGRRLPCLPLLAVAVGEHPEHLRGVVEPVEPQRQADAHAHREALPERAGRDLDAGRAAHVGVSLELGADLAQPHQVLEREVAVLSQRRVLDRSGVALAEHEAIARRPVGILGVVAQHAVVERRDDVGRRQRRVQVAGLRHREHPHAVEAKHRRPALELRNRRLRLRALGELRAAAWDPEPASGVSRRRG